MDFLQKYQAKIVKNQTIMLDNCSIPFAELPNKTTLVKTNFQVRIPANSEAILPVHCTKAQTCSSGINWLNCKKIQNHGSKNSNYKSKQA